MIKTYRANTNISINVVLPNKKNLHISFSALSNGSSVYTTDNEDIQKAIESHYKFGKLFKLFKSFKSTATQKTVKDKINEGPNEDDKINEDDEIIKEPNEDDKINEDDEINEGPNEDDKINEDNEINEGPNEDNEPETKSTLLKKVEVSDIATAKDYLAEKFGISRTSMRSTKSIVEHAKIQGIEFVGF